MFTTSINDFHLRITTNSHTFFLFFSQGATAKKQSRSEKKSRQAVAKLGLKPVPDVLRVTMKRPKNAMLVITRPDVFKAPSSDTYVIFGEAKMEDTTNSAAINAAKEFEKLRTAGGAAAAAPSAAPTSAAAPASAPASAPATTAPAQAQPAEQTPAPGFFMHQVVVLSSVAPAKEAVDETGLKTTDIETVMKQANVDRATAVKALREKKGDMVEAIMVCFYASFRFIIFIFLHFDRFSLFPRLCRDQFLVSRPLLPEIKIYFRLNLYKALFYVIYALDFVCYSGEITS